MMERDKLINAPPQEVARGIVAIADVVQKMPAHMRALTVAGFLTLLVESMELEPQDVMTVVGNIRTHAERTGNTEFKAIEAYLREDY